jgi:LPXTG-site transpeptidase (sortase) family protein
MAQLSKDIIFYIRENFFQFFGVFFVTVFLSYLFLYIIDVYPEPKEGTTTTENEMSEIEQGTDVLDGVDVAPASDSEPTAEGELPVSITLESLSRTVNVLNSASADLATLEADLQSGVIRHPDSVKLGEKGNVVILGHSSYLPNVMNKNYQAFNGIQDMKWGEEITVMSQEKVYTYRVERVYKATTDEVVPVEGDTEMLTLVTCNVFGSKEDRYILEATLQSVDEV